MHERCKDGWLRSYCFLFSFNFLSTLSHTHTHIHPYMDCCFCRTWRLSVGTILLNRVLHRSTALCSYRENRKSRIFNVTSLFHVMQSMCLFVFQIRDRVMLCYVSHSFFFSLFRCTKFSMHLLGILLNLVCYFCNKKKMATNSKTDFTCFLSERPPIISVLHINDSNFTWRKPKFRCVN